VHRNWLNFACDGELDRASACSSFLTRRSPASCFRTDWCAEAGLVAVVEGVRRRFWGRRTFGWLDEC
jgi:hypothetical protein